MNSDPRQDKLNKFPSLKFDSSLQSDQVASLGLGRAYRDPRVSSLHLPHNLTNLHQSVSNSSSAVINPVSQSYMLKRPRLDKQVVFGEIRRSPRTRTPFEERVPPNDEDDDHGSGNKLAESPESMIDVRTIKSSPIDMITLSSDDEETQAEPVTSRPSFGVIDSPESPAKSRSTEAPNSRKVPPICSFPEYKLTLWPWLRTNSTKATSIYESITTQPEPSVPSSSTQIASPSKSPIDSPASPLPPKQAQCTSTPIIRLNGLPAMKKITKKLSFNPYEKKQVLKSKEPEKMPKTIPKPPVQSQPIGRKVTETKNERKKESAVPVEAKVNPIGSQKKIPYNWFDASKFIVKLPIVVEIIDNKGIISDGHRTKFIFQSVYDKLGKFDNLIANVKTESDHIKLYFDNKTDRDKIRQELDRIASNQDLNCKMVVKIPKFEKPSVYFVSEREIDRTNKSDWIAKIKRLNRWPQDGHVAWKSTSQTPSGKFRVVLTVDSKIRTLIEEKNAKIMVNDGVQVEVYDDFDLKQCHQCFDFGHLRSNCKRVQRRCYFCCKRFHGSGVCPDRNAPSQWFCAFCNTRGHSACSKKCPILMKNLRPQLERFDHRYKFVFLEPSRGQRLCDETSQCQRVVAENREANSQMNTNKKVQPKGSIASLVNELVSSKMIDPNRSGQIYRKIRDHLGPS